MCVRVCICSGRIREKKGKGREKQGEKMVERKAKVKE
jgi:hypothetical protein